MKPIDRKLHLECLSHAADSRRMWQHMRATGHGWTWAHYRGWLMDARSFRLGTTFKALGREGISHREMSRLLHA